MKFRLKWIYFSLNIKQLTKRKTNWLTFDVKTEMRPLFTGRIDCQAGVRPDVVRSRIKDGKRKRISATQKRDSVSGIRQKGCAAEPDNIWNITENTILINTKIDSKNELSQELTARKVYSFGGKANKNKTLLYFYL